MILLLFVKKLKLIFTLLLLLISVSFATAQSQENGNFRLRGFGVSLGVYDPELDYWKSDTNSQFRNADFSTNIFAKGFVEFTLVKNLVAVAGLGYWQTRAETTIPKYGKTSMLLTGNPLSLDLVYHLEPLKFSFVTPYLGAGGEFVFIQYSLDFEEKENPDPVNGSSAMVTGLFGLELGFSDHFAIDLFGEYKYGTYDQSFVRQVINPDPEMPDAEVEVSETISLTGPKLGLSLKYLF